MYLKSIEVQGFKSFAQKTRFEFHDGITAIVGPNGSGKSNVADAVRWVLGEQKYKQLRSSGSQDVIFSGTETRKPQSYAYVALTLDNSDHKLPVDYAEVTVARRIYRSGESEYLMNGTACRLKDIVELFYDTGIGKEGYSIIGQGQIDQILSGKPEERRALFDEAAGIVKYKRRKTITQKKLESEEQNLTRVNDILSELERQVGPLKRQSENARIFLKKREELKDRDVNLFLLESDSLQKEKDELSDKIQIAQSQKETAEKNRGKAIEAFELASKKISELEESMQEVRDEKTRAELAEQQAENEIRVLNEQIRAIESDSAHYESRKQELAERIRQHQQTREEYESQKNGLDQELQRIREKKAAAVRRQEENQEAMAYSEHAIESANRQMIELLNERARLKAQQQRFVTMKEQEDIHKASLNSSMLLQKAASSDTDQRLSEANRACESITESIHSLEEKRSEITGKRSGWREKIDQERHEFEELKDRFNRLSSRRDSMKNIAERYDGYGNSIRRVMEQKQQTPGIHGVVADLIRVKKDYEIAVETALGGSIQNIVTEDEQTATRMISYLKKNHYGRATFLPLTSVRAPERVPAREALREEGAIGMADTLVETDERYRGVTGHLLGRTLVADTIEHALAIARRHRYSLRIVTLGGESLSPGGAMTGGAFKNNSNLLGRNREIEELEKQIEEIRRSAKKKRNHIEEMRTASELLKEELSGLNVKLQEAYLSQNTARLKAEQIRDEQKQKEKEFSDTEDEIAASNTRLLQIANEQESVQIALEESEKEETALREQIRAEQEHLETCQTGQRELDNQVASVTVEEASCEQKAEFANENIQRLFAELKQLSDESELLDATAGNSGEQIQNKQLEIEACRREVGRRKEESQKCQETLSGMMQEKERYSTDHKEALKTREDLAEEISETEKELMRLNVRLEKNTESMSSRTEYMWEEYELTPHTALELKNETYSDAKLLKKEIAGIRNEIRALGSVNVNAIEEYKEVSERYEFLSTQRDDIEKARTALLDIINELDTGMRRQFAEKFADIQEQFNTVFRELFGGGKGTLELTEEEDILESGIRIIAQPPGKKLQNMMQLSGGEKALTAISLLFAIQNLKPSPFCLLDEIEAALDDSNVGRYAQYLHNLTKNTQFIVITHRRGTMNAADRLYGITMQEKGVSALVSVDLIESGLEE